MQNFPITTEPSHLQGFFFFFVLEFIPLNFYN